MLVGKQLQLLKQNVHKKDSAPQQPSLSTSLNLQNLFLHS